MNDPVNHPAQYTQHPSGLECIAVTRTMGFSLGNAVKYVWRAEHKNGLEDLRKARFYLTDVLRHGGYGHIPTLDLRCVAAAEIRKSVRHSFFCAIADFDVRKALRAVEQMITDAEAL